MSSAGLPGGRSMRRPESGRDRRCCRPADPRRHGDALPFSAPALRPPACRHCAAAADAPAPTAPSTTAPAAMPTMPFSSIGPIAPAQAAPAGRLRLDPVAERRDAVREDAAADQEHRRRAGDRQALHQPGRGRAGWPGRAPAAPAPSRRAGLLRQVQPDVVELDDAGHQAVDADGHHQRDAGQHRELRDERLAGDVPSVIAMISADRMKSVRIAPLILSLLERDHVDVGIGERLDAAWLRAPVVARGAGTCAPASRSPRSRGRRRRASAAASPPTARRR